MLFKLIIRPFNLLNLFLKIVPFLQWPRTVNKAPFKKGTNWNMPLKNQISCLAMDKDQAHSIYKLYPGCFSFMGATLLIDI